MDTKRANIDGRMYNVVTPEVYAKNPELYPMYSTAIEDKNHILPIRNRTDERTGVFFDGMIFGILEENIGSIDKYSKENLEIIDLANSSNISEIISKQERIAQINREYIESVDSVYVPCRNEGDVPEMRGFKDALEAKHIDIDKYTPRYEEITGCKYGNDKRLLNKEEMTIKKMKGFADTFDIKMTITFEDKNPNVPNPIGKKISVVITSDDIASYES